MSTVSNKRQSNKTKKYYIKCFDSFDHDTWTAERNLTLEAAKIKADDMTRGKDMLIAYVHEHGTDNVIYKSGRY